MFKVAFDLDNTIANYELVFIHICHILKLDLIDFSKENVKSKIIELYGEAEWTKWQGRIYGPEMGFAKPFEGWKNALQKLDQRLSITIISHRSQYSHSDERLDLHRPAQLWVKQHVSMISGYKRIYLEETVDEKIDRINKLKPEIFVDDLEHVLTHEKFNQGIRRVLFSPCKDISTNPNNDIIVMKHWDEFPEICKGL